MVKVQSKLERVTLQRYEITARELLNGDYLIDETRWPGFIEQIWGLHTAVRGYLRDGVWHAAIRGYAPGRGLTYLDPNENVVVFRIVDESKTNG